jgi:hypothetical protein
MVPHWPWIELGERSWSLLLVYKVLSTVALFVYVVKASASRKCYPYGAFTPVYINAQHSVLATSTRTRAQRTESVQRTQ